MRGGVTRTAPVPEGAGSALAIPGTSNTNPRKGDNVQIFIVTYTDPERIARASRIRRAVERVRMIMACRKRAEARKGAK